MSFKGYNLKTVGLQPEVKSVLNDLVLQSQEIVNELNSLKSGNQTIQTRRKR
jgi:hypothetical protein